jgi:hypothetical protein
MRKLALNLLRQEQSMQVGIAAKQKRAGWDHDYLLKINWLRVLQTILTSCSL